MNAFAISNLFVLITNITMAGLVLITNHRSRLYRVLALFYVVVSIWGATGFMIATSKTPEEGLFWGRVCHLGVIFIPITFYHFVVEFMGKRRPRALLAIYLIGFLFLLLDATPYFIGSVRFVFGQFYYHRAGPIYIAFYLFFLTLVTLSHVELWFFMKRTPSGIRRLQVKWFFLATLTGFSGGNMNFFPVFGLNIYPWGNFGVAFYAVMNTYGILRYRLLDINVAVTRGVTFLFLVGLVLGLPFWLGTQFQAGLQAALGTWWWGVPVAFMGLLAAVAPSTYLFIQRRTEGRLLREQRRYQTVLRQSSAGMTRIRDLRRLSSFITHVTTRVAGIAHGSLFLYDKTRHEYLLKAERGHPTLQAGYRLAADSPLAQCVQHDQDLVVTEELRLPDRPGGHGGHAARLLPELERLQFSVVVPLAIEHRVLGMLALGPKRSGKIYHSSDLEAFATLANQASLAIENAMVFEELVRTQAEVVVQETRATTDALTGLLVRRAFLERAAATLERARLQGRPCSLLMMDLDHFKEKNDEYGHLVGDVVLQEAATRLGRTLRQGDLLGRFGGEEFVLLLPGTDRAQGLAIAERLRQQVAAETIQTSNVTILQTVSIGVASFPADGETMELLLGKADVALYAAKRAGRNRVVAS